MIILITCVHYPKHKPRGEVIVSHGVDYNTDKNVILPNETISYYKMHGAYWDEIIGEWVLPDTKELDKN